jgi:polysaccharide biosynthesis protein PslG
MKNTKICTVTLDSHHSAVQSASAYMAKFYLIFSRYRSAILGLITLSIVFLSSYVSKPLYSSTQDYSVHNRNPPALAISRSIPNGLGVAVHFVEPKAGEMEMITSAGFKFVRVDFLWEWTEREKGQYDFSAYDRLLSELQKYKVRPIFILAYTHPSHDMGLSPYSESGRQAFVKWVEAAVNRYRGKNIIWEIYNEPNNKEFWRPKSDVNNYIRLALEVGKSIQKISPREVQIGPALSRFDFSFLESCFRAGVLKYWSGVSVHPYRKEDPETVDEEFSKLRELIDKYSPSHRVIPVISSEWGYSSVKSWFGGSFDENIQGKYLARKYLNNLVNGVNLSIWYVWRNIGDDIENADHNFGIVRHPHNEERKPVFKPKPAYYAAQTLTKVLEGFQYKERLKIGDSSNYILHFKNSSRQSRFAVWTTSNTHRNIIIPGKSGRFSIINHLGENQGAISSESAGLHVTLTDSPQYLFPLNS